MDVLYRESVRLELGDDVCDTIRVVINGFAKDIFGYGEPYVLVVQSVATRLCYAAVDPIEDFIEYGDLFYVTSLVFLE